MKEIFITTTNTFHEILTDEYERVGSSLLTDATRWDVIDCVTYSDSISGESEEVPSVWHYQHPFAADDITHEVWSEISLGFNSTIGRWEHNNGEVVGVSSSQNFYTGGNFTHLILSLIWQTEKRIREGMEVCVVMSENEANPQLETILQNLGASWIILSLNKTTTTLFVDN